MRIALLFALFVMMIPRCFAQTASELGNTGLWKVISAETLERGRSSVSVWYDRINRNPGNLTVSTTGVSAAVGINARLELGVAFEADKNVSVGRQDQLSFGQQALGFFGNKTPGSPPFPGERVPGSSSLPQLRSPATPNGTLTGAAGYYNLLPFAGLVKEADGIGQVMIAAKWKLLSQSSGAPIGLAARAHFDVPIRKGIDYLLSHPVGTADLQYGFDAIVSRAIGDSADLHLNVGYRHINQPVHVSVVQLADEAPLAFGWSIPRTNRIQFVGESTAEIFIGSHTPNTSFGAANPVDLTAGFRFELTPRWILTAGYRRPLNQFGGDKNGFVVSGSFVQPK
jgi:hypothetical protein